MAVPDGLLVVVLGAHALEPAVGGAAVRDRDDVVGVARGLAADDARRVVLQLAITHRAPGRRGVEGGAGGVLGLVRGPAAGRRRSRRSTWARRRLGSLDVSAIHALLLALLGLAPLLGLALDPPIVHVAVDAGRAAIAHAAYGLSVDLVLPLTQAVPAVRFAVRLVPTSHCHVVAPTLDRRLVLLLEPAFALQLPALPRRMSLGESLLDEGSLGRGVLRLAFQAPLGRVSSGLKASWPRGQNWRFLVTSAPYRRPTAEISSRFPASALVVIAVGKRRSGRESRPPTSPLRLGRLGDGYVRVAKGGGPMIWTILALGCIVLGFVGEIIDERILLGTLEWFVAAIAFNTLGSLPFVKKR